MKKYVPSSIALIFLFTLLASCVSPTSETTLSPNAIQTESAQLTEIVIDGRGSDWESYPLASTDAEGDQVSGTPDIGEVRAFYNDQYFYLYIRLNAEGVTDHYDILLDADGGGSDYQVSIWPQNKQAVFSEFPVAGDMNPLASVSTAKGEIIEMKMPLSAIGSGRVQSIQLQTWMDGVIGDMVENAPVRLMDENESNGVFVDVAPTIVIKPSATSQFSERLGHVQVGESLADYVYRAFLQIPVGIVWGPDNMLYVADWTGRHVVRITKNGIMDDLPFWKSVKELQGDGPRGIAFDSKGVLYVSNHDNIFRVEPDGSVTILQNVIGGPLGSIAISPSDDLYYTDRTDRGNASGALRRWRDGISETIVEHLPFAENMLFGLDGTLYLTQMAQSQVLKIDVTTGAVSTFKENVCGNDPCFLAVDKEGDIWVRGIAILSQFTPDGIEKPFIVDGQSYPGGSYNWRTAAGIAFDDEGGLWVASYGSQLIRLAPTIPGLPDPEYTMEVIYPGFENADLEVGLNGEIYASEDYLGQILRINPDGDVDIFLDHGFQGHTGLAIDGNGIIYAGIPNGEIVRIQADGIASHYAQLTSHRMSFGGDGALYAVVGDFGRANTYIVRITDVDTFTVIATEIDGISLGNGEAHVSAASDEGFYIYVEQTCDLFFMDFNGQGHLIANVSPLGCGGPAIMAASPVDGSILLLTHGPYQLYRFTPDGQYTPIATHIFGDPLGMVVSLDGLWVYIAENGAIDKIPLKLATP